MCQFLSITGCYVARTSATWSTINSAMLLLRILRYSSRACMQAPAADGTAVPQAATAPPPPAHGSSDSPANLLSQLGMGSPPPSAPPAPESPAPATQSARSLIDQLQSGGKGHHGSAALDGVQRSSLSYTAGVTSGSLPSRPRPPTGPPPPLLAPVPAHAPAGPPAEPQSGPGARASAGDVLAPFRAVDRAPQAAESAPEAPVGHVASQQPIPHRHTSAGDTLLQQLGVAPTRHSAGAAVGTSERPSGGEAAGGEGLRGEQVLPREALRRALAAALQDDAVVDAIAHALARQGIALHPP